MMLLFLGALCFGGAVFLAAEAATLPARQRRELLKRAANYGSKPLPTAERSGKASFGERVVEPFLKSIARFVMRLTPKTTRESIGNRLLSAGLAHSLTPDQYLGLKGLLGACGILVGLFGGSSISGGMAGFALALVLGGVGFIGPDLFVSSRVTRRRDSVQAALSDALDLLAVSVEAGLGFDGAIAKLTEYMGGPLVEEFSLTLNEMRLGKSRTEALRRMSGRMNVPELSAFVRAVVQADQLGMSMGNMLRVQASDARIRRQLTAEEKAMKAPIKMLFPTVLFIFPAMFIVILGPAFLNIGKVF